jgi:hypothetical protein
LYTRYRTYVNLLPEDLSILATSSLDLLPRRKTAGSLRRAEVQVAFV